MTPPTRLNNLIPKRPTQYSAAQTNFFGVWHYTAPHEAAAARRVQWVENFRLADVLLPGTPSSHDLVGVQHSFRAFLESS